MLNLVEKKRDAFAGGSRFINNAPSAVIDSLQGLVASNPQTALLNFGKVVVRRDYVGITLIKLLSGCASGHEPAFAGFVGKGMLTASVQGDIFSSPTSQDVLKAIREIAYLQDTGILVIIRNDASDRFSFGLAIQRAQNLGIGVKMMIVGDDCCTSQVPYRGKRGLSGIIFFHKIAGAMAQRDYDFNKIYSFCEEMQSNVRSMMFSLNSATSISASTCICENQLETTQMEICGGLHGEKGSRVSKMSVSSTCEFIIKEMIPTCLKVVSGDSVVVLVNNLGGSLLLEELTVVKEFMRRLQEMNILVVRAYYGQFLTSLDRKGFTVSILKVFDKSIVEFLDDPCEAPAWRQVYNVDCSSIHRVPIDGRLKSDKRRQTPLGPLLSDENANIITIILQFCCDALISCEKQINMYDSECGSGNVGTRVSKFCKTILFNMEKKTLNLHYPRALFTLLSEWTETFLGSSLGCLYSLMFEAVARVLRKFPEEYQPTLLDWMSCLGEAKQAVKNCGGVEFGMGTMYDPLHVCHSALEDSLKHGNKNIDAIGDGITSAEKIVSLTIKPPLRYPDPGVYVVVLWMRALYEGLKLRYGFTC